MKNSTYSKITTSLAFFGILTLILNPVNAAENFDFNASIEAPTAKAATKINGTSFQANWSAVKNVDGYKLYVYTVGRLQTKNYVTSFNPKLVTGAGTDSFEVTGLSINTTYYFALKAVNTNGKSSIDSDLSNVISVKTLATAPNAPVATAASDMWTSSFKANWELSEGATTYELTIINGTPGVIGQHKAVEGYDGKVINETSFSLPDSTLVSNEDYYYYVVAVNDIGKSAQSNNIALTTLSKSFVANEATNITSSSFQTNWEPVPGALRYKIVVRDQETNQYFGSNIYVEGGEANNYTVSGTEPNRDYSYQIRGVVDRGIFSYSNWIFVKTLAEALPAPENVTTTNIKDSSFYASWDAVGNTTEYKLTVYYKNAEGEKVFLNDYKPKVLNQNFTGTHVTGLTPSTTYYWYVQAANSSGTSDESVTETVTAKMTGTSSLSVSDITANSCQINWSPVAGALSYNLWVQDENDNYLQGVGPKSLTENSFLLTGLEPNTEYYIAVSVVFISGESVRTSSYKISTQKHTVVLSASPDVAGSVSGTYSYDTDNMETIYNAQATANGGYSFVNWTEDGTEVSNNANYSFTVNEDRTLVANFIYTAPPSAPEIHGTSQIKETSFWVEWRSVENATEYKLTVYSLNDSGDKVYVEAYNPKITEQLNASVTGLQPNTTYYWYVQAANANGDSEKSALQGVKTSMAGVETGVLSLSATPVEGGTVNGAGTFNLESSVSVQAAANEDYAFVNWTEGGTEVSTEATYTFTLNADKSLVAHFRLTTAIADKVLKQLHVWPNPMTNTLNISEIPSKASLQISSLLGQLVFQKEHCNTSESINIQDLKNGIYILRIENEEIRFSKKIIKR